MESTERNYLDEVYINGNKAEVITYSYTLNKIVNLVELVWYNLIDDYQHIFDECSDITEIDFSNFNTSKVIYMNYMFYGCPLLTSLDIKF